MALQAADIARLLDDAERACLDQLEAFESIESTNTYLLWQPAPAAGRFRAAIADYQTQGRGRQGRRWIAPPGAAICLSISGTFGQMPTNLPSLTLAMGVGVVATLRTLGAEDVALKWPNDVVARGGKLGGILTEASARGLGCTVVIGLGLNVDLPPAMREEPLDRWATKPTDLRECVAALPSNAQLAAGLLGCMIATFSRFARDGFAPFHAAWRDYDWLEGRDVRVTREEETLEGRAAGIEADGALRLATADGVRRILTGSIEAVDA
jgi:BirA family biotin operon repressor/biotin-[acetyl-CoA-carboxylase] ligase